MFVCGNATRNLESMCRTDCDNVSIDENVPLEMLKEFAATYNRSFGGNIKLTSVLLLGDEDDAKLEAIRCMEIGGTNGFILAPGCDLPYGVPPANLEAVALMVHDDYQRHVANTTLHAKAAYSFDDVALPDYAGESRVIVDVITLDSASCAPCQYMVNAARHAAEGLGNQVAVYERKITTHEGLGFLSKLGVENLPTICIDGRPAFVSIIPDGDTLQRALEDAVQQKERS
jgi:uroporphyrinogen decarboxylase